MTLEQIWARLVEKRPGLNDPGAEITITSDNLKGLLRQVFEQGQNSIVPRPSESKTENDFMKKMFGM